MKQETKTNGMCIAGFVCAFFVPLLGLIFSIIGFNQVKKSEEKGRGLAIAGIIIGAIFTIIAFFMIASMISAISAVGNVNPDLSDKTSVDMVNAINNAATPQSVIDEFTDLKILDLSCNYGNYEWVEVKGRVKNNGVNKVDFVEVDIDLFNGDKWIESGYTFVRTTDLSPGETDSFEKTFGWDSDTKIVFTRCEARLS